MTADTARIVAKENCPTCKAKPGQRCHGAPIKNGVATQWDEAIHAARRLEDLIEMPRFFRKLGL